MNIKIIRWDRSLDPPGECSVTLEVSHGSIRGQMTLGIAPEDLDRLERLEQAIGVAAEQVDEWKL